MLDTFFLLDLKIAKRLFYFSSINLFASARVGTYSDDFNLRVFFLCSASNDHYTINSLYANWEGQVSSLQVLNFPRDKRIDLELIIKK